VEVWWGGTGAVGGPFSPPHLFTFVATEEAHGFKETGNDGQAGA
jgi:hypothetical protein